MLCLFIKASADEKLCKDQLNLDIEIELEWKKVHDDFENIHNKFTDIPIIK